MVCRLIKAPEEYVDRSFQEILAGFLSSDKNVMILEAPTGAGKTTAFSRLFNDRFKTIVVMPNNVLIDQNYTAFSSTIPGVSEITGSSLQEEMNKYNQKKDVLISKIIGQSSIIFTNPTLLFYILLNFYKIPHSRSDQVSDLVLEGVRCVVLDEFHVYSIDQKYRLIALLSLFRKKIKFIISSATLDEGLVALLKNILNENELQIVEVQKSGRDLIRGPVEYDLHSETALDVIREHIKDLKDGKWFLILDSIRECHEVKDLMCSNGINGQDICLLNRLDLSKYESKDTALKDCFEHRIVIASNIVEQGYNPPKEFTNFIIDRGYYGHNLRQRAGRIGRGINFTSRLIISIGDPALISRVWSRIESGENLIERLSEEIGEQHGVMKPYIVGVYAGFLNEFFTPDARRILLSEAVKTQKSEYISGMKRVISIFEALSKLNLTDIPKNCDGLQYFVKWFNDYKETFRHFIGDREDATFLMEEDNSEDQKIEQFNYDAIWLIQNTDYTNVDGIIKVNGFKNKPDNNFDIYVVGFPYVTEGTKKVRISFTRLYHREKQEIEKRLNNCIEEYLKFCPLLDYDTAKELKNIVSLTAYPERLKLLVEI
ncbi:type I-D CRISPR-associated helicase Cas3' [Thermoplasma sp. Kam2015]|uniref:type I-D CRISPR-associated helicase Cas3' n=1 Tax=Thermoplasma sp. Kam2015 TaxID=2094122 RepID=UPI000D84D36E|nr:type I-D CRISPR-associated helicase Cas3' [Thermoplasma sp. Kam2015]PYB67553.1 type I-D CRISPR-associated helicase Cas3' [Thermoplasma sp. Kam2015]